MTELEKLARRIHRCAYEFYTCGEIHNINGTYFKYNKIMSPYGRRSALWWMKDGKQGIKCPIERKEVRQNIVLLYQEFLNDQPNG